MEPLYEGKAKKLYATDQPDVLRMEYKDDATAFNAEKKAQFENKGKLNKAITLLMYQKGLAFREPIVEFSYKSDELGDPLINDDYAREMDLATPEESAFLKKQALVINEVMGEFFLECGMKLVDFKIEFGRLASGEIVLADEVSPDTCRLWDATTGEKMDKDRFRQDLGGVMEGYEQVLARIEKARA